MIESSKIYRGKRQPSLIFWNDKTKSFQDDIWDELEAGLWKEYNLGNFIHNSLLLDNDRNSMLPVFPDIYPLYPGYVWDPINRITTEKLFTPERKDVSMQSFLSATERYFSQFEGKKIGVHLSGGLDSSLIIVLLHHFGIKLVLVGFASSRFEFRTERMLQDIIGKYGTEVVLLDYDNYKDFGDLSKYQKTQIPDFSIANDGCFIELADEFAKRGVEVVFTGQGGDSILVDEVPNEGKLTSFNIDDLFVRHEERDFIYGPRGMELISFFADKEIITQLTNLRSGHSEDVWKLWAREFFKDFLPRELVEYHYCADFVGHSLSRQYATTEDRRAIMLKAYEYSQNDLINPTRIDELISVDPLDMEQPEIMKQRAYLSYATWINALFRKD